MDRSENTQQLLSGVFLNQNQPSATVNPTIAFTNSWVYQEFYFPDDYRRGSDSTEYIIPEFSGFQIKVNIAPGAAEAAGLDYVVERYLFGTGWTTELEGTTVQSHLDGDEVWFDVYFDKLIQPTEISLEERWRIGLRGRTGTGTIHQVIPYDGRVASIGTTELTIALTPGRAVPVSTGGVAGVLYQDPDDELVYYSVQQGITHLHYSTPNPLATLGATRLSDEDGDAIQVGGVDVSLMFRLLGMIGDEGTDFLGNTYRSAIHRNGVDAVASDFGGEADTFWLSKPNPSRFAVECLYFDVRDDSDRAQVIDQVLVDPITPNVYFHIYYSSDGPPGDSEFTWEERIWQHIPKTFRMTKRESHVLPEPITAKYICIEFSHLQPKPYTPGDFEQPIAYKKHPRWVLDYFLFRTQLDRYTSTGNNFVPRSVGITYDALDLAYNYRLDDIQQEPEAPIIIDPSDRNLRADELVQQPDNTEVDSDTLDKINLVLEPFREHPAFRATQYLLSEAIRAGFDTNYAVELPDLPLQSYDISALRSVHKDAIVYEATHPVMFFFMPTRHRYKELRAGFSHHRAYFAGIRQIAFTRERYSIANDTPMYIETMGDSVNMEHSDFVRVEEGRYAVYR